MTICYWPLPDQLQLAICAPEPVVQQLAYSLVLQDQPSEWATQTIWLYWSEEAYRHYALTYWQAQYAPADVVWWEQGSSWLTGGDGYVLSYSASNRTAQFFAVPERLDDMYTFSYPLLSLLTYLLNQQGFVPFHASVIGRQNQFVLLPGKQHTGKSTTALSWVLGGGQFLTDDFCFLKPDNPTQVYGFYPTFRIREEALPIIGHQLPLEQCWQKNQSKYFFSTLIHRPGHFVPHASLKAIYCLRLQAGAPSSRPVPSQVGFEYLASSLAFAAQYRANTRLCLQGIKKLIRELPVIEVSLSRSVEANVAFLDQLISG